MKRLKATHFIEVYKVYDKIELSTGLISRINCLESYLKFTSNSMGLKTIVIWKIKFKDIHFVNIDHPLSRRPFIHFTNPRIFGK